MAESELDKHTHLVLDLTRKVDELQLKADEAERLKDQVDEYVFVVVIEGIDLECQSDLDIDMLLTSCKRRRT